MGCGITSPKECTPGNIIGGAVSSAAGSAVDNLAQSIGDAVGDGLAALGTLWVNIDTPDLAGGSAEGRNAGSTPPGSSGIETVLSYMLWIGLAVCILSLMAAGVRMALPHRQQVEGGEDVARIGTVLMATIVISGGSALVGGLFRDGRLSQSSDTVSFIQNSLWWYVLALATVSAIVAGIKMAWEQRAEPGRDLVRSLLTLVLISAAAIPVLGILVSAADEFSEWIIGGALDCDAAADTACFSDNVGRLIVFSSASSGGTLAPIMVIVLGLVAILTSLAQIALMVARAGMLVLLAGILPLAAAATNTETGRGWFKKAAAWLVAWLLYKPAAAVVYATAFHLSGSDVFTDDGTGLVAALTGVMLMILAIIALPALMRFVTPAVSAVAAGTGGGMAMAMAAMPANGAISAIGRMGSSGADAGPSGSRGAEGAPAQAGLPTGANSPGGQGDSGPLNGGGRAGSNGPGGGPGGAPSGAPTGAPGSESVPATGGAAVTGSELAGAGAAGGAGAGTAGASTGAAAAAGPVGLAVVAAEGGKQLGTELGKAAEGAVRSTTEQASDDESGGSR